MKTKLARQAIIWKRNNRFFQINFLLLIIFFSCGNLFAQEFQIVRDGIEYAKFVRQIKSADGKSEPVAVNLL
ncbi:MAG: hypothetical protein ABR566_04460, partial [Pyrinomonadaceae bacterium]